LEAVHSVVSGPNVLG